MLVHVKHAGKTYDVDLPDESLGISLKEKLSELTQVEASRQKVLVRGKQLSSEVTLSDAGLKNGQTVMMLGTAAAKAEIKAPEPSESADQKTSGSGGENDNVRIPPGFPNMGNTCYANSTLQAMRMIPELGGAAAEYGGTNLLVKSLSSLIAPPVESRSPYVFIQALRSRFPQFAEVGDHGIPKQQDAEELWTNLIQELKSSGVDAARQLLDGEFDVTTRCEEHDEPAVHSHEEFAKLNCHISVHTNFLKDGLRAALTEEITKHNDALGADARYTVSRRISRLPKYLTVQFVRFFWRRDTSMNSKILRRVAFPLQLDVQDLCTPELQQKMRPIRDAFREVETEVEEAKRAARRAKFSDKNVSAEVPAEKLEALKQKFRDSAATFSDKNASPHGIYDLVAVVTHQGMSADSGHYQCFTKNKKRPNAWWRFNDDKVTEVDDARIEGLAGGGESDSALILLYKSAEE